MGGGPTGAKIRQVIAIFRSGAQLDRALQGLERAGIQAPQWSLLASRKSVEDGLRPALDTASTDALASLVGDMFDIGITDQSGPILVSAGPLAGLFEASVENKSATLGSLLNRWLIHRHADALEKQLEAGSCLLWVRVSNEKEERQTCGVLLRFSEHPVQVHDIPDAGASLHP